MAKFWCMSSPLPGRSIESAELQQGDNTLSLNIEPVALPVTQWILLDASDEMVNFRSNVYTNVQLFLQSSEQNLTGLISYNNDLNILPPTNDAEQIEDFMSNYFAIAESPACLGDAIEALNDNFRDLDRSWRILIITTGDFSRQASCGTQDLAALPAPVDIIAITDVEDDNLLDLVAMSGGDIRRANALSIKTRMTEISTLWGQSSYALTADWSADWDKEASFDINMTLSSGSVETTTVEIQEYNLKPAPQPTVEPTSPAESTIAPRATSVDETTPSSVDDTADANGGNNVAFLLVVGAILFFVGAIVLAFAMSRVRRPAPSQPTGDNRNFYDTLDETEVEAAVGATKIRERSIVGDDEPITRMAPKTSDTTTDTQAAQSSAYSARFEDDSNEDEMLVTQVLTDDRFKNMVQQSLGDDDIVGWLRLMTETDPQDFELTTRGAVVGRSQDCDIQVRGDRAISRQHARLDVRSNGQVTISRMSAVNPVLVGGVQVSNRHPLKPNDVIHLSDRTRLIFIAKDNNFDEDETAF